MRLLRRIRFSLRTLLLLVLLIGSAMGLWYRWEPWVLERVLMPQGPPRSGEHLADAIFSSDGRRVVLRSYSGYGLGEWDTASGQLLSPDGSSLSPEPAKYSGTPLFVPTDGGRAHEWSAGQEYTPELRSCIRLRRVHRFLTIRERVYLPVLWNADTGEMIAVLRTEDLDWMFCRHTSPDESRIITTLEGKVIVWDARNGTALTSFGSSARSVDFSPSEERIAVTDRENAGVWLRRRPEYWWGVACLPQFWLTVVFGAALVWSVWRDRRTL
jgi:hypothetical protein